MKTLSQFAMSSPPPPNSNIASTPKVGARDKTYPEDQLCELVRYMCFLYIKSALWHSKSVYKGPQHPWNFLCNSIQLKSTKKQHRNYIIRSCINTFSYKNLNSGFGAKGLLYKSIQNLMLVMGNILNFHYCKYFTQNELFCLMTL